MDAASLLSAPELVGLRTRVAAELRNEFINAARSRRRRPSPGPRQFAGSTRCRPRIEGLFARIERRHESNNDYWEVRSEDGLISLYCTPRGHRHLAHATASRKEGEAI
jgi:hypothetical protein